jgi:hypothetical protein
MSSFLKALESSDGKQERNTQKNSEATKKEQTLL